MQINKGFNDTVPSNPITLNLVRDGLNYGADFRKLRETASELHLVNMTSPLDQQEIVKFARRDIANVYQGTDITSAFHAPSKKGVNLHCQLQEVFKVTDESDSSLDIRLPLKASITIQTPASYVSAEDVIAVVERLCSTLFETNSVSADRVRALLRGALTPKDL